jgi:hypothetical protein
MSLFEFRRGLMAATSSGAATSHGQTVLLAIS